MKQKLFYLIFLLLLICWAISSCISQESTDDVILIRIRNDSEFDIDNFWLGAGPRGGATSNTAYGAIDNGTETEYRAVEPILANYRKMNMVVNGRRYLGVIDPKVHLGQSTLISGHRYTFAYDIVGEEAELTLIQDE